MQLTLEAVSLSRARDVGTCPRMDWWARRGARYGWDPNAPEEARFAWRLKALTSLTGALGVALHECAARIARAYRDGRRPPTYGELLAFLRHYLNSLVRADRRAFERAPRRAGFLRELWYGEDLTPEAIERMRVRMRALLRRLVAHPIWDAVRLCGRGDVVITDALDYMLTEFVGLGSVRVYAAPDLVFVSRAVLELPGYGIPVPAGTAVIHDWKSGHHEWREQEAYDQVCVYGWYCLEKLCLPMGPLGYVGRIGDLASADPEAAEPQWLVGEREIAHGRAVIRRALEQIRRYTDERGELVKERTPMVLSACRFCPFPAVCHRDLVVR